MPEGVLCYIIGPSGSGKDSLMRYARDRINGAAGVIFAHRYITRPAEPQGENHVVLSEGEFQARAAAGLFAMHWRSHGLRYGIGCELGQWLGAGFKVVVNGSRSYLPEARQRYPRLFAVLIDADPAVIASRLRARGRETGDEVALRLDRNAKFPDLGGGITVIRNDNEVSEGGERLVQLLSGLADSARLGA
jgi:ribose 1,5-bisphosphokinase